MRDILIGWKHVRTPSLLNADFQDVLPGLIFPDVASNHLIPSLAHLLLLGLFYYYYHHCYYSLSSLLSFINIIIIIYYHHYYYHLSAPMETLKALKPNHKHHITEEEVR